ncbi:phosphoglycerate kinase [Acidiphilium multivorum AIU301]|uniref:Phosphoglycerate kinase n=2 Tax=Acidiphilium TaxID=522 RepID=A5FXV1_ACICJ|nr:MULTISPECIES: phosphoglycerate kinase [Acidiphilium]MBU6358143.1 phosphoglycerate kinase [Rhodospirillales bacterium]ABQ30433.1 phosphoglycerate kinase [Acidiphilium cryptum JF-5]KDM65937.1 phosphoglycerate kinase Pgk [Acidiphilium sp. JA12-A1]BAJ80610.1 phosphoglycerate kinase [Acidiphilium multivorum AIU301]GAN74347.1 phosphoglycerate kinase [Acidiphilium multivorum AIU301]
MADWRPLDGVDVRGKRVLVRADLNVPLRDGRITDLTRIERLSPTIVELAGKGAKVIVLSHFDRPKGKVVPDMSLRPVAAALGAVLRRPTAFAADCIGPEAEAAVAAMAEGDILVLENTRFHPGEESNDPALAKAIAANGDIFVNDAFSAAHRAHATTEGLAHLLPAYAGRLMQAELAALEAALSHPKRPVGAIVGGSKVSTKLDLLTNLITKVDLLVIGGAMANTFLAAQGAELGKSLQEPALHDTARAIVESAATHGCRILLPSDFVVSETFAPNPPTETVPANAVPANAMALDVGPATTETIIAAVKELKTLIWNGPLGAFETPPFDTSTMRLAIAVAEATAGGLISVAGGGDTVAALRLAGVTDRLTYVSSAGGAFLEWMEGKTLPGVAALAPR